MSQQQQTTIVPDEKKPRRKFTPEEQLRNAEDKVRAIKRKAWAKTIASLNVAIDALVEASDNMPDSVDEKMKTDVLDRIDNLGEFKNSVVKLSMELTK